MSRQVYLLALTLMVGMLAFSGVASAAALDTLKQKPFPPTNKTLFSPVIYDGPPLVPAGPTANDEATLRNQLRALLIKRFGSGSVQVTQTLAIFDSANAKQKVSHPRLRAALVALKGTVGEPAISEVLDGPFVEARFVSASELVSPSVIAQVIPDQNGNPTVLFNEKYQYEDLRLLAPTMAHESMHQDPAVGGHEELVANSTDTLVYGQFLLETPSTATSDTELARRQNTELMARLNTRDVQGNLRLLTSTGNVYPGGKKPLANFAAAFDLSVNPNTPGNAAMRQMVQNVVGPGVTVTANARFDDATIDLLDRNQNALTGAQAVRLARILKLNVYAPTVTRFGPTKSTTSRTPTIGAKVTDRETNLAKANIKLFVDGRSKTTFSYNRGTDRLSYRSSRLSFGRHTVKVVATDAQGKRAVKAWSFKIAKRR